MPERIGKDGYPPEWHATIKHAVRQQADDRCVRCSHPYAKGEQDKFMPPVGGYSIAADGTRSCDGDRTDKGNCARCGHDVATHAMGDAYLADMSRCPGYSERAVAHAICAEIDQMVPVENQHEGEM